MKHSPGFLRLVDEARPRVREISVEQAQQLRDTDPAVVLLDVREDSEFAAGHAKGAVHLGKGVLERDLESRFPDPNTRLVMYCGGGYRSVLTCEVAQRLGYKNVSSVQGGYRAIVAAGWPLE